MASTVFFVPTRNDEPIESLQAKTRLVFEQCGGDKVFTDGAMTAIKLHLGEKPHTQYIDPAIVKVVVERAKEAGAKPFLTDTCTLYNGRRSNAVDYLHAAAEHGFTLEAVGAPVIIADGLVGGSQVMVPIGKKHFQEVPVALDAVHADGLVVMTHVTGHMLAGLGGTIKNISMGLCGRAAKLAMHSGSRPQIDKDKCGACGRCAKWCPAGAVHVASTAEIDYVKCIGCGECYAVCRSDAVLFNWDVSSDDFNEKMVEACLGAVKDKPGRVVYLNYAIKITEQCDCFGVVAPRVVDDLGILAGFDPVAVDMATADLLGRRDGKDVFEQYWSKCHYRRQFEYGQAIGLGSTDYRVVEVGGAA